jgi:hypothetical protein
MILFDGLEAINEVSEANLREGISRLSVKILFIQRADSGSGRMKLDVDLSPVENSKRWLGVWQREGRLILSRSSKGWFFASFWARSARMEGEAIWPRGENDVEGVDMYFLFQKELPPIPSVSWSMP